MRPVAEASATCPAFMARILRRMKAQSGETLIETLAAILVSSLSILLLATAMASTIHIILDTNQKMEDYYAANVRLTEKTGTSESASAQLTSGSGETPTQVESMGTVNLYKNTEFDEVIAY